MELRTRSGLLILASLLLCCQVCPQEEAQDREEEDEEGGDNLDSVGLAASLGSLSLLESTSIASLLSTETMSSRELEELEDNNSSVKLPATNHLEAKSNDNTTTVQTYNDTDHNAFNRTDGKYDSRHNMTVYDGNITTVERDDTWIPLYDNITMKQNISQSGFNKSQSNDTLFWEGSLNISTTVSPNSHMMKNGSSGDIRSNSSAVNSSIGAHISVITDLPLASSTPHTKLTSTNHVPGFPSDKHHFVPTRPVPSTTKTVTSTLLPVLHKPPPPHHTPPHAPNAPHRPPGGNGRHEIAGMDPLALGIGICIPILLVIVVILSVFCYRKYKKGGRGYITLDDFGTFEGMQNPNYDGEL